MENILAELTDSQLKIIDFLMNCPNRCGVLAGRKHSKNVATLKKLKIISAFGRNTKVKRYRINDNVFPSPESRSYFKELMKASEIEQENFYNG